LARIESLYRERLRESGLADGDDLRHAAALEPSVPSEWRQIWLIGVPDMSPLLPVALARAVDGGALMASVLVSAPEALGAGFDAWGRVEPAFWTRRVVAWEDFSKQVKLVATPEALSVALTDALPQGSGAGQWATVGVLARELAPVASGAVERAGASAHDPEGTPKHHHALGVLLRLLRELLAGEEARAVSGLLRLPFFMRSPALSATPERLSLSAVLTEWDALREAHLPDTLGDMQTFAKQAAEERGDGIGAVGIRQLDALLGKLADWRWRFEKGDWGEALRALLQAVFEGKSFDGTDAADRATLEVLETILAEVDSLAPLAARHKLAAADWLALVSRRLAAERTTAEPEDGAVPLLGWMELLWEDAPCLLLAGLNDGWVPENVTADPFLPGSFREKIGLASNDTRLAVAAYGLQKMLAQRAGAVGRLVAFVLQADAQGNPLRPSRLLFLTENATLPERVRRLFAEPVAPAPEPAWQAGWRFVPVARDGALERLREHLSVTRLRDYLDCPFRFFLKHVAKMQAGDPWKAEPDALEFGSAMHAALEAFARDEAIRESTDAAAIGRFTVERLDEWLAKNYGANRPLPVAVMAEAARNRLAAFAQAQAALRAEGWRVRYVEATFAELLGKPFRLDEGGVEIRGKIDRIDFHEEHGWRILDYKTSTKAKTPHEAHLATMRSGSAWPPAFAQLDGTDGNGRARALRWVDLQLPLYRHLFGVAQGEPFERVRLAYFNLPQAVSETALVEWTQYSRELDVGAVACARGILAGIAGGEFWPPNPHVEYDDFEKLFWPSPEAVVDGAAFVASLSTNFTN
jgi:ATP-dependent helicase/nuclease subunit B